MQKSGKMTNPYIYGSVIRQDNQFYGRLSLIKALSAADSKAYFVKGNRRIGKTSLLRYIERRLLSSDDCFPVYLDLSIGNSLNDFGRMLRNAIDISYAELGLTKINFTKGDNLFKNIATWLKYSNMNGRKKCVLLLDEAEAFLKLDNRDLELLHHQMANRMDNLTVVMTATNQIEQLYNRKINGDHLLTGFINLTIGRLNYEEASGLIRQSLAPGAVKARGIIVEELFKYCGGHPFLLQRLCFELFDSGRLGTIKNEDLVLDQSLRHFFDGDFRHLDSDCQQVLLRFKWETGLTFAEIGILPRPSCEAAFKEMTELGFLIKVGDKYFLSNIFLALWLEEKRLRIGESPLIQIVEQRPPKRIFISYSHNNRKAKDRLRIHFKVLELNGKIEIWEDTHLRPGAQWDPEIENQLAQAEIFVFLVSPDLLASNYVMEKELPLALARHLKDGIQVVPVIMRPCLWENTDFSRFQVLPGDGRPVSTFRNRDEAMTEVAKRLLDLVKN